MNIHIYADKGHYIYLKDGKVDQSIGDKKVWINWSQTTIGGKNTGIF